MGIRKGTDHKIWHIEIDTKWPPFWRRRFLIGEVYFSGMKCIENSLEFLPNSPVVKYQAFIDSDNGLVLKRRQAIILTNDGIV